MGQGRLQCGECETVFEMRPSKSGGGVVVELEPLLPAMPLEATPVRRTCIPLEQGRLQLENNASLLCRTCLNHQNILLQLLSAYETPPGLSEDVEASRLREYRDDLEQRYPLCSTCKTRVQERLRIVEYKVRCRRLACRSRSNQVETIHQIPRSRLSHRRLFSLIDAFLIQSLFSGLFLTESVGLDIMTRWPLVSQYFLWYGIVFPPAVLTISSHIYEPLICGWALFLLILRLAMINLIATRTVFSPDLFPPPFAFLSIACYGLLWQIYSCPSTTTTTSTSNQYSFQKGTRTAPNPAVPLKPTTFYPTGKGIPLTPVGTTSSGKDDLVGKLATWDTALEKLDSKTPLSTRFTDLGIPRSVSTRSSPFSIPKLSLISSSTRQSQPKTPSPFISMRPSIMDGMRASGLESVLEGFSLDEGGNGGGDKCNLDSSKSMKTFLNSMDQLVLTICFLLARIAVNEQLSLIAVLLVVAIGLRSLVWPRISSVTRLTLNILVLLRFSWLITLFNPSVVAGFTILHERMINFEYVMDMLILLSR